MTVSSEHSQVVRERSKKGRGLIGLIASVALALGGALVVPAVANAAATPVISGVATEVANERVDFAVSGSGFDDVQALPGQSVPHAYVMLVKKGADLSTISQGATSSSLDVVNGAISGTLSVPVAELEAGNAYELISWPARSNPSESNLYARADVAIDWDALFPAAPEPTYNPVLTVSPNADLDPAGDTVTVSGAGYNPTTPIYVFLCGDIALPADLWSHALGCRASAKVVYAANETNPDRVKFNTDGSFELEYVASAVTGESGTAVFTAANHTAPTYRVQDAKAALSFDAAHETTTSLDVSPAASTFGDEATLTATLSPAGAKGSVTFFDGGVQIGDSVAVTNGVAELKTSELAAGSHDLTAEFVSTNANQYIGSESDATSLTVAKARTTTSLSASPVSTTLGSPVELTATVAPATNGSVKFFNGDQELGTGNVVDGVATLTVTNLRGGANSVSAIFTSADANYNGSASANVAVTVYNPQLTVSRNADLDPAGETVTASGTGYNPKTPIYVFFCADIALPANLWTHALGCASGAMVIYPVTDTNPDHVKFKADGSFEVQFAVSAKPGSAGTSLFTAANHAAPTDRGQDAKVMLDFAAAHETTTSLDVSPAAPTYGDEVTLTASLSPADAKGAVSFFDGGVQVGEPVAVVNGVAELKTSELAAGSHELTAEFASANANQYADSDSSTETLEVAQVGTVTILSASTGSPEVYQGFMLSATVDPAASGNVEFFRDGSSMGSAAVVGGIARQPVSIFQVGTYNITAKFTSTDANFAGSSAAALSLDVVKASTSLMLSVPATVELGTATTLTAKVEPAIAGTVEFLANGDQIAASVDVVDGVASIVTDELDLETYSFEAVFTPAESNIYKGTQARQTVITVDHSKATVLLNGKPTLVVAPGEKVVFSAGQFAEGTEVSAEVHSDPILLGSKVVGTDGMVSYTWTVPADFSGQHSVIFTTANGTVISAEFTVDAAAAAAAAAAAGTTTGGLAVTGADGIAGLAVAALVLVLAGGFVVMRRRAVDHV